jgi:monofunctional biosynthetic peptidoglycan transglycosylase
MPATPTRKPSWRKWLRIIGLSIAAFFGFTILWVVALKWINPPTTYLQLTGDCPKGSEFHKEWVDGSEISSHMKLAVVASEDNNFMKHGGIDWGAVEKARKYNETEGKRKGKYRGASTITQQTAKNVFLWPGQSKVSKWIRKGFEVYFTYLIEWIWGKERIMEVYLNVIEMGPCKYGVGAAAKDYFGVSASNLSREQAALIAACLPNPKKYSVSKPGSYMKKRQTQIARLMRLIGDDYFNRYSKDVAEEKREAEEREVEEKLKAVPDEDIPTVIEEEQEVQELPAEESKNDPVMEEETAPVETAVPDSTSSL